MPEYVPVFQWEGSNGSSTHKRKSDAKFSDSGFGGLQLAVTCKCEHPRPTLKRGILSLDNRERLKYA